MLLAALGSLVLSASASAGSAQPAIDARRDEAWSFARATEARCGFPSGAAFTVPDTKTVMLRPMGRRASDKQFRCLFDAINAPEVRRRGIKVDLITEGRVR